MISSIDGYEVRQEWFIGRGSFGSVYKAKKNNKFYAIKIFRTELLQTEYKARIDVEIKALKKITHPNVVKLHDHGKFVDNAFEYIFIVMDLVEGRSLSQLIGNSNETKTKQLAKSIFKTLDSVHLSGVIHRDLKPDNIILNSEDVPIILDLGLSKLIDYSSITQTGDRVGSYAYMSPEQVIDSRRIDSRSDYFAMGILLYQLITGSLPYDATNLPALIEQIKNKYPKNPSQLNPDISNEFENTILKLIEKDAYRRFQNIDEIIAALENSTPPIVRKLNLSLKKYLRLNHNDKTLFYDAHKDGLIESIIYPASYFGRNHPTVDLIKKSKVTFATDPATNRMSYTAFSKTKGVLELPYSSGSPVTPTSLEDFESLMQVQEFVKNVLQYQVENGVTELAAPFFYARSVSDEWFEVNIKLLKESVALRDKEYSKFPIWAGICMNVDQWHDKSEKNRILNEYVKVSVDGYFIYGDPIGNSSNLTQLFHYSDLALNLQKASGAPVVASRVNGLGLILVGFGLSGLSYGAGSLDSFRESILFDKADGYTNDPRYYIPEIMSMISLTKGTTTKLEDIKASSIGSNLFCLCKYCININRGLVVHADIKKHFLYRRKQEIDIIKKLDSHKRIDYIEKRVADAINYEKKLSNEKIKLGDLSHLDNLHLLVQELKKR